MRVAGVRTRDPHTRLGVLEVQAPKSPTELRVADIVHLERHLEVGDRVSGNGADLPHLVSDAHSKIGVAVRHSILLILEVLAPCVREGVRGSVLHRRWARVLQFYL